MKRIQELLLGTVVAAGVAGFAVLTPSVSAGVVLHIDVGAPAPPAPVVYHYVYYPEEEVYFVPESRVYWWVDANGQWISGPRVPEGISLSASVNLDVDARDPWRHHSVIVEKYPGHKHRDRDRDHDHDRH